jgi:Zn-dependent protease with chaperone function
LELILASSFIPFFAYLLLVFGRQYLRALYYATKRGEMDTKLTVIAKKENPQINKVIVKEIDRKLAYVNSITNNVVLSRKLLEVLTHEETLAVLYHEIGHGAFHSLPRRILQLVFIIPAFFVIYVVSSMLVYTLVNFIPVFLWNQLSLVLVPSFLFCVLIIIFERKIIWPSEYKADATASKKVGIETMVSALKKTLSPESDFCDSPTHPSLKRRIAYLRKMWSKN